VLLKRVIREHTVVHTAEQSKWTRDGVADMDTHENRALIEL
jgi:hypothetical protein